VRRVARLLIRLYPGNWRERYGEEFEALIEDSPTSAGGLFDLLKGAIRMQMAVPSLPVLALVLSSVGVLAGLGISYLVTPSYVSTATLRFTQVQISPRAEVRPNLHEHMQACQQDVLSRTSLSWVIQDPRLDLYKNERARIPLEDVIEEMRHDVQVLPVAAESSSPVSLLFGIRFSYRDPEKAQKTVQTLLTRFQESNLFRQRDAMEAKRVRSLDQVDRMEARIAALEKRLGISSAPAASEDSRALARAIGFQLEVLDPPSMPQRPVFPNRIAFVATGLGAGLGLAGMVAVFRRRPPPIPFPAQPV
jgi:hypothetical protein